MTKEKIMNEIEFKKYCIFYTERLIKDPPIDSLSQDMIAQADRLKMELINFETELSRLTSVKTKKKQTVTPKKRSKK